MTTTSSKASSEGATVQRLEKLQSLLIGHRDAYYRALQAGRDLSVRMYRWIDEYDQARGMPAWYEFCAKHKLATSHRALDTFA